MELTDGNRVTLDTLSYIQMLARWRNAPIGDPWFQGETGVYFEQRMVELRKAGADPVAASKRVGWDG